MTVNLSYFESENGYVKELRDFTAGAFIKSCRDGYFNRNVWRGIDTLSDWTYGNLGLLSYGNVISDDLQRILLTEEWAKSSHGFNGFATPAEIIPPESPKFVFWIRTVEQLKNFSLFGEFMAEKITPYLYSICEQILNDRNNQMKIHINNYFFHQGQYSESRNTVQKKKNDLLLQVIRLLNKCPE